MVLHRQASPHLGLTRLVSTQAINHLAEIPESVLLYCLGRPTELDQQTYL